MVRPLRRKRRRPGWREFFAEPAEVTDRHPESDLWRLFLNHDGRQVFKWTHYIPAYEEQFGVYRGRPLRMLEIGVLYGGSLQMWRRWFGPEAVIVGVDVDERVLTEPDPALTIRIGSQDDPAFLRSVVEEMGGVDIVLDDGSHRAAHQRASFAALFPLLSDGGIYAVEDLHTSYWPEFGGRLGRGEGFVELVKTLIDDMHAWYHDGKDRTGVAAHRTIPKITVYDSIAFIAKAPRPKPAVVKVGRPTF